MIAYLRRAFPALLRRSRTLYALTVVGVALGVASVVCIQTINQSALAAFSGGVQAVSGDADLTVLGQGPDLADSLLVAVLADRDVATAWPLTHTPVAVTHTGTPGSPEYLEVIGIDFFAPVRYPISAERVREIGATPAPDALAAALTEPGWVAITPRFAAAHGLAEGDTIAISSGSRAWCLHVGALVDFRRLAPLASGKMALMDIAQAQAMFGRRGRIQQIDLTVREGVDVARAQSRLQAVLGPGVRVVTPDQRDQDAAGLLAAFRLNLTALSLISVFVGVFLIFTAIHASLVRRRREFGLLRTLGGTRRQVLGLILVEAGMLGLAGTALGLPLGYLAARANVATVSSTLTNIYLLSAIEKLTFPPVLAGVAVAVGVGGALLGAWLPAADMSRRDPAALLAAGGLQEKLGKAAPRLALGALGLAAVTLVWFISFGTRVKASGFVLAIALLALLPLVTPWLLRAGCGRVRPGGFGWRLSLRNLAVRLQSTSFAVAALAVTVTMMVGITLQIGSFRRTLETWIGLTLRADVYVSTESWVQGGSQAVLGDALADSLAGFPDIVGADVQRRVTARTVEGRRLFISGMRRLGRESDAWAARLPLLAGKREAVERRLREGGTVLISEPLSRKAHLGIGDTLRVAGPSGPVPLEVVGVGYDYSTESGTAFVTRPTLDAIYGPGGATNLALYVAPGVDVEHTVDALRAAYAGRPLVFRSNRRLREEVMGIFDQTFAITRILQAMALLIAVCGISLTLVIMARERAAELALYRALGATQRQVFGLAVGEAGAMGLAGLLLGTIGGAGLAAILILLINRAYFGWTIRFGLPVGDLLRESAWVLAGALAASIVPALRGSRTAAAELTREDLQ